jgi:hypothetical protein
MASESLPRWRSPSPPIRDHAFRPCGSLRPRRNGVLKTVILIAFILISLICYMTLTPHGPSWITPSDWYDLSRGRPNYPQRVHADPSVFSSVTLAYPLPASTEIPEPPSLSLIPAELTLEQIRDIVTPTRGYFSRDYSLHLGWNNVSITGIGSAQRTESPFVRCGTSSIRPSFKQDCSIAPWLFLHPSTLARASTRCTSFFHSTSAMVSLQRIMAPSEVCAEYAVMVNKSDAFGSDEWRELPREQQLGFCIPISTVLDLARLRARGPVITALEYLRLHGQGPEVESTSGRWLQGSYHLYPNVFESNQTKKPSLFVIENHWYDPENTNRVDYIPQEMKRRGNWTEDEQTEISKLLRESADQRSVVADWEPAKDVLKSSWFGPDVDLDDDSVVENILNANGWEVLYTFSHLWVPSLFFT